jgi:23S rRNA (pseudouridine1915-N3)-methyltransferase
MLRIKIITVGKNKERWVEEAVEHYLRLLKKFASVSIIYIPGIKKPASISDTEIVRREADLIAGKCTSGYKIALSDKGRRLDSRQFAKFLARITRDSGGSVDFIIGGIYGLDDSIVRACNESLSLSNLTMSHQLIRPVLLEQLYRAFSILSGGKYHK